jgi:hypothetical protein
MLANLKHFQDLISRIEIPLDSKTNIVLKNSSSQKKNILFPNTINSIKRPENKQRKVIKRISTRNSI